MLSRDIRQLARLVGKAYRTEAEWKNRRGEITAEWENQKVKQELNGKLKRRNKAE